MKIALLYLSLLISLCSNCQSIDSNWIIKNALPAFNVAQNTALATMEFVDIHGNVKRLSDFKGKTLYLKLWSTFCNPCIADFPYQAQLLKRITESHLDTSILFVNIDIEDSKSVWKSALNKYHPVGINLYSSDSTIFEKWGFDAIPFYIIIDSQGHLVGKDVPTASDGSIDWLLYCSAKGYNPIESTWRAYTQNKLMEKYRTSKAFTDSEYALWFDRSLPAFIEFNNWRASHMKNKSR